MGNFCIWEMSAFFWVYRLFLMCQRFIMGVKGLNKVSQEKFSSLVWCKISGTYRILPSCWSCLWTLLCWRPWHSLCSATWLLVKARAFVHPVPTFTGTYICPSLLPPPALPSRNTMQDKSVPRLHRPSRTANSLKRGKHIQSWRGLTRVNTSLTPRERQGGAVALHMNFCHVTDLFLVRSELVSMTWWYWC